MQSDDFTLSQSQIDQKLNALKKEIEQLRIAFSQAGLTQWRENAERTAIDNKAYLHTIEETLLKMRATINEQSVRLNRASMSTVKNVSQLVSSVRVQNLQAVAEEKSAELKQTCETNLSHLAQVTRSYQWKNLFLVIVLSVLVTSIISLYTDNAWPWQAHMQIMQEREAGKTLINNWTNLSHNDQLAIIQNA